MDIQLVLFLLRILSALLLLAFFGLALWLIYDDLRVAEASLADRKRRYGYLVVLDEHVSLLEARRYPLYSVTSIGRRPDNTVVIDDHYASAHHALLSLRGQQWWLEDLGSRNGTLLNDMPVSEATVVSAGDIITIGHTQFKLELGA